MSQTKVLSLVAPATFKCVVNIPRAGSAPAPVTFEFKHRRRDDLIAFIRHIAESGIPDEQLVTDIAVGWDGPDRPFSAEAVAMLCANYHSAAGAVWDAYIAAFFDPKPRS